jgi:hypothetical protein
MHNKSERLGAVNCLMCKDLRRVFEAAINDYQGALLSPFYRVSTEVAARMQVDMERANTALSEHLSSCSTLQFPNHSSSNTNLAIAS